MDLGPCNKTHDPALKADFEIASQKRDYGYDIDVSIHVIILKLVVPYWADRDVRGFKQPG